MGCNIEACAECTQNCLLIHGKKKDPSPTITSFFKVMIGDNFSKVLFWPPKFARTVSALVGQKTHLEDSIGRQWMVTVSNINGSIAFQQGWHAFSLDHDLEVGDFLVFNYITGSHFVVQIYGRSGCQKLLFSEKSSGCKKRTRTNSDYIAKDGPCDTVDNGSMNKEDSSTSVVSQSDIEVTESQCHMIDVEKVSMVMEETLAFDRDPRFKQREGRSSLHELSNFERPISNFGHADGTNKLLVEDEKSPHADTVLISQTEAVLVDNGPAAEAVLVDNGPAAEAVVVDNGPAAERMLVDNGTAAEAVGSWASLSETSHFAMNAKNDDSVRMDKIIMSRKDSGNCNTSRHLLDTSAVETARNGNDHLEMSNMVIMQRQNAKQRRVTRSSTNGVSQKEGTCLVESSPSVQQKNTGSSEFCDLPVSIAMQNCQFGERTQVVKKEREMCSHEETKHGKKPKIINQCGQSSSLAIKDNNKGYEVVKTEPVDSIDFSSVDAINISCLVVGDGQSFLELPTRLPSISFNGRTRMERKVVLLRDPVSRLWPVLYQEKYGFKVLTSGWEAFSKANNIQSGDRCVFGVENVLECIYRVDIVRK